MAVMPKLREVECLYCRWKVECFLFSLKNESIYKNRNWLRWDRENYLFAQKWPLMGSIIGHRIDYNRVGALRGQRHLLSTNLPKYPLSTIAPSRTMHKGSLPRRSRDTYHMVLTCSHGGWLLLKCSAIGIGFNGAETNCGIARILGILLMNSCDT